MWIGRFFCIFPVCNPVEWDEMWNRTPTGLLFPAESDVHHLEHAIHDQYVRIDLHHKRIEIQDPERSGTPVTDIIVPRMRFLISLNWRKSAATRTSISQSRGLASRLMGQAAAAQLKSNFLNYLFKGNFKVRQFKLETASSSVVAAEADKAARQKVGN